MKSKTHKVDYLIVGQGIAGTVLSYFLQQANQSVFVIDNNHQSASSTVAAGIINPITGRRFVKSWMIDELLPFAKQTYQALEKQLNASFYQERNILRILFSAGEENDWLNRSAIPDFAPYMLDEADDRQFKNKIKPAYSAAELQHTGQLDMSKLLELWKKHLQEKKSLLIADFNFEELTLLSNQVQYKNVEAKKVIFCQGYQSIINPWFKDLPFVLAKGEILIVKIQDAHFDKMLKHKLFVVPLHDDLYWIGATYDWKFENDQPTENTKLKLIQKLESLLEVPFEVVDHLAGIRPTVFDRRPLIGLHPEHPQLGIFNGLGTKGASLAPYWANAFVEYLLNGKVLNSAVSILRRAKS